MPTYADSSKHHALWHYQHYGSILDWLPTDPMTGYNSDGQLHWNQFYMLSQCSLHLHFHQPKSGEFLPWHAEKKYNPGTGLDSVVCNHSYCSLISPPTSKKKVKYQFDEITSFAQFFPHLCFLLFIHPYSFIQTYSAFRILVHRNIHLHRHILHSEF